MILTNYRYAIADAIVDMSELQMILARQSLPAVGVENAVIERIEVLEQTLEFLATMPDIRPHVCIAVGFDLDGQPVDVEHEY